MKRLPVLVTLVLLPLMLVVRQPPGSSGVSAADLPPNLEKDVSTGNQEWIDGLKAGNADHVVSSYAEDSVFCSAAGDCVKGQVAIAALYKDVISKFGRAMGASVRSAALRVDHDLAYESGDAEAHFNNGVVRKGRFSTVWKLQPDGHWKIFRNMSLPAPGS